MIDSCNAAGTMLVLGSKLAVLASLAVLPLLWGCASVPGHNSKPAAAQIENTGPEAQAAALTTESGPEQFSVEPKHITFEEKGPGSCLLHFPAAQEIQVQPEYAHSVLSLDFSDALPRPLIKDIPAECPVQDIVFIPENAEKIQGLRLELTDRVQFLVSRSEPDQLRIFLISRQAGPAAEDFPGDQKNKTLKRTENKGLELQDLDFSLDQEQQLKITLTASGYIDYQPQPGKDKEIRLLLSALDIPEELDKFYNLRRFNSCVETVWLEEALSGALLRIKLQDRVPFNIEQTENQLLITFVDFAVPATAELKQAKTKPGSAIKQPGHPTPDAAPGRGLTDQITAEDLSVLSGGYSGQPISIDLQDAEVEHVLRLIAEVGGLNLILDEEVQGRISLKLSNVPWDQVLDLVLVQKDLGKERQDNILRISSLEKLEKEQELAPLRTSYIQINYATAEDIKPQVSEFLTAGRGKVSVDSRTNQIIVSDTAKKLEQIQGVIQKLDQPERQVLIEARLVYATDTFQRSLGLRWGAEYIEPAGDYGDPTRDEYMINLPGPGPGGFALGAFVERLTGSGMIVLDAQLSLGEEKGQAQTISSPRVLTLTNQRAEIEQGTRIRTTRLDEAGNPIIEYVDATLNLTVTPQITPDNRIILDLNIKDDSPAPEGGDNIETRSTNTKLMVDNGQTIVLGGVQQITDQTVHGKIPGLASIPLLGYLFKNQRLEQRENELLIFIQPRILEN